MASYISGLVYMWLDANDEEKSRLLLDTAYELRISLAEVRNHFPPGTSEADPTGNHPALDE